MQLHRRLCAAVLVSGAVLPGAALPAAAAPGPAGAPAPLGYTTYGSPTTVCTPTDPRLGSISGIAATARGLFVQNDSDGALRQVDADCRLVRDVPLPGAPALRDTEEVAANPDGTLWIGDIGGNRFTRSSVSVVEVPPGGGRTTTYSFSYPDGPHDAESLLISPDHRQILIVTKVPSGVSTVFAPAVAPKANGTVPLKAVGTVRANALADRNPGKSAMLFTGGAVSPDGLHLVLRSYTDAWEWDAPDGNLLAALSTLPRKVDLSVPVSKQGEGITYSADGRALLTAGEQLDPVYRVEIDRPRYAPTGTVTDDGQPSTPVNRNRVARILVGGAVLCLVVLVGAVIVERRRSRRRAAVAKPARQLSRHRSSG